MQPKFEKMTNAQLRAYALAHRDEIEPLRVLFSRRTPDSEATWYGPLVTSDGEPIEENIRISESAIRQRIAQIEEKRRERELGEKNGDKIKKDVVNYQKSKMITVTPEQIEQFRKQLAEYPEALPALDIIEEWDGDLADAAESIAKRNGIQGVETNADLRWFTQKLEESQKFICQPKYENLRNNSLSAIISALTEFLAGSLGCPPGVATIIATPFALSIAQEGMDKFCQSFNSQP